MSRSNMIVTGLVGVMGGIFLTALCVFIVTTGWLNPPLGQPEYVIGLFLFLFIFSVLEIPVMVFAIRRMLASVNPRARYVAMFTNAAYTFFAAVYAAPFILLAGQTTPKLMLGVGLSALSLIRFISTVVFLPDAKQIRS